VQLIDFGRFLNGDETKKAAAVKGVIDGFKNAGFLCVTTTPDRSARDERGN
jgi:hypothetical protein